MERAAGAFSLREEKNLIKIKKTHFWRVFLTCLRLVYRSTGKRLATGSLGGKNAPAGAYSLSFFSSSAGFSDFVPFARFFLHSAQNSRVTFELFFLSLDIKIYF